MSTATTAPRQTGRAATASTAFPVGHYAGVPVDPRPADHLVRVGYTLEGLTEDEFGVWVLAHGLPQTADRDWTRRHIVERADAARIEQAGDRYDELVGRGLLAAVPVGPDRDGEVEAFVRGHRLHPLLVGLGAVNGQPEHHAIGVPGVGTAALLDEACFDLWRWAAITSSLWRYCERLAPARPGDATAGVLVALRTLIVHGCGYLDVAPAV